MLLNHKELMKLKQIEENTKVKFEQFEVEEDGNNDSQRSHLQKRNWNEDQPRKDFNNQRKPDFKRGQG